MGDDENRERPGLLSKTNPQATPASTARAALYGAIGGVIFWFLVQPWKLNWVAPLWTLPLACAIGAGIAATIEWQLDDSDNYEDEDQVV